MSSEGIVYIQEPDPMTNCHPEHEAPTRSAK
jgi:hypothetical protein